MRRQLTLRCILIAASGAASACSGATGPGTDPNYISLQSDPGDVIGGGLSYRYTQANSIIAVTVVGNAISMTITADDSWTGAFQEMSSLSRLEPGTYGALHGFPVSDPTKGAMSWYTPTRRCATLTGSFSISSVSYEGPNLAAIDLQFEQHCEDGTPALHGTIHWRSDDPTKPPGPVNPIPPLWKPTSLPSIPPAESYVHLESDPGDPVGGGAVVTYAAPDSPITLQSWDFSLTIDVARSSAGFVAINSLTRLEQGYYPDLHSPMTNPTRGSFVWYSGAACGFVVGWVAIDHLTYYKGVLTAIDFRFEQHCDGAAPSLHGVVHWKA